MSGGELYTAPKTDRFLAREPALFPAISHPSSSIRPRISEKPSSPRRYNSGVCSLRKTGDAPSAARAGEKHSTSGCQPPVAKVTSLETASFFRGPTTLDPLVDPPSREARTPLPVRYFSPIVQHPAAWRLLRRVHRANDPRRSIPRRTHWGIQNGVRVGLFVLRATGMETLFNRIVEILPLFPFPSISLSLSRLFAG